MNQMVPELLTSLDRWILWRNVTRGKRVTKEPYAYRGGLASTTNPSDWTSWSNVQSAMARTPGGWDGPGVVLGDLGNDEVLAGLDLDKCLEDGALTEWCKPYLRILPTYCEISPSGTGLKLFFRAKVTDLAAARRLLGLADDESGRKKTYGVSSDGHPPSAELYLSARYFTVTGATWPGNPEEIAIVPASAFTSLAELFGRREATKVADAEDFTAPDAAALLRKVEEAKQRNRALRERWDGNKSGLTDASRSGFDMSLGTLLKTCGFTYGEMRAAIIANPHGAGAEKAEESDERYFQRIWSRSQIGTPAQAEEPHEAAAEAPNGVGDTKKTNHNSLILTYFDDIQITKESTYIVEELLDEGSAAVVYGESNCGKTFWVSDLSLHIASGISWNGREVLQGGVVYVSAEGNRGFRKRIIAWKSEKLDDQHVCFAAIQQSVNLLDPSADTPRLIAAVREAAAHFAMPIKLVVVDTLSRALAGGNENSPEDMGALVANMDTIRQETDAAVVFIHHCGKDAARGARGHSLLKAAIDTEIEVVAVEGSPARTATVVKQREMETTGTFEFTLEVVQLGQTDRGKPITSCIVKPGDKPVDDMSPAGAKKTIPRGQPTLAYRILCDLITQTGEAGYFGVPSGCLSVPEDWWRDRFYERAQPGAERKTKEKAFRRAADALTASNAVACNKGRVWVC